MGLFDKVKNSLGSNNFKYIDDLLRKGEKKIVLNSDISLGRSEKSKYMSGIPINGDDIVIDGNGHTIDAKGKTRIFQCRGKNVTIKNITLKNGHAEKGNGGVIINAGSLSVVDSIIEGSTSWEGGAIYNNGGVLDITNTIFKDNTVEYYGGAIENNNGDVTVRKSTLRANTSKADGSSIRNTLGKLNIIGSDFIENNGGVVIYNKEGELNISDSSFNENRTKHAGSIKNEKGDLTIEKSTFDGNICDNKYDYNDCSGAIFNMEGNVIISKSTFSNNVSKETGAIIHLKGDFKMFNCEFSGNSAPDNIILNKDSLQIHDTDFIGNNSCNIILNNSEEYNLGVENGEFKENDVKEALIYNDGKSCTVDGSIFENNRCDFDIVNKRNLILISPTINDEGKTIMNEDHILLKKCPSDFLSKIHDYGTIETDIIPDDKKPDFGHLDEIIHEGKTKEIILEEDFLLENYEIDYYEGGIELDIDNLVIDGNGKTIDGANKSRIFVITGDNIKLKNLTLKNGLAHINYDNPLNSSGGALKINRNKNLTIENCRFLANGSDENGGAIENSGELTIVHSALNNNTSEYWGGAIINWGKLSLIESTLGENKTKNGDGGAISNRGILKIEKSDLNYNAAEAHQTNGGAIDNHGELRIRGSSFSQNISKWYGGAIQNHGELFIMESEFSCNATSSYGGAIRNMEGKLKVTDSAFNENKGYGGALYNGGESSIAKSSFSRNASPIWGGAIYNGGGELNVTESDFCRNTASRDGGAVCNYGGEMKISKSRLDENEAEIGDAVYNKSQLAISDSLFNENSIYNYGELNISQSSCSLESSNKSILLFNGEDATIKLIDMEFSGGDSSKASIINRGILSIEGQFSSSPQSMVNYGHVIAPEDIADTIDNLNVSTLRASYENPRNFTYLNELIHETDEIVLKNDIVLDESNNEGKTFKDGIKIDMDNLVIDGDGHTIDGRFMARMFECTGKNVTIKNIVFKNGLAEGRGSAINNTGELTVLDCTFDQNAAKGGWGSGAINNERKLSVLRSRFTKNKSQGNAGAINNKNGELTVVDSVFDENSANVVGGAIYNIGELKISESLFMKNTSIKDGGAIYNYKGDITITNSKFCQNMTEKDGGAINNFWGDCLTIVKSAFDENNAQSGGAIYSGKLAISGSIFNKNAAKKDGGAIYCFSRMSIRDSALNDNISKNGGGIYLSDSECESDNCAFKDNEPDNIYRK